MKRLGAVFTIALVLGDNPRASGWRASTNSRQERPTEIDKCQTISQSGSYKLVNNLTFNGPSGSACLSITANFVTIDLAGFTITGTFPSGGPSPAFPMAIEARNDLRASPCGTGRSQEISVTGWSFPATALS